MTERLRPLRDLVLRWVEGSADLLRISAFSRDVDALLELTPPRPADARQKGGVAVAGLFDTAQELDHFLRRQLRPALRPRAGAAPVCSPYAGAVLQSGPPVAAGPPGSSLAPPSEEQLTLAVLNPGRSGFLHLGSELLMEWRLEAVAHALDQDGG